MLPLKSVVKLELAFKYMLILLQFYATRIDYELLICRIYLWCLVM